MRRLILAAFAVLLPLSTASSQVVVRGGIGISFGSHVRVHSGYHRPTRVHAPAPRGYWRTVCDRVWVEPCYEWRRDACGRYYKVCVRPGYWSQVERRVWVGC